MTKRSRKKIKVKTREEKDERKKRIFLIVFFLLAIFSALFSVLSILSSEKEFVRANTLLFNILACGFIGLLYIFCVYLILKNKETLIKIFLSVFIFLSFCFLLIFVLQKTGFFKVIQNPDTLQTYLEKSGGWMPAFYVILQYLQVVVLPIPSIVSTVAGVALFGAFKTLIYSLIGILLGSLTAFWIGRKLGYKAVRWMIGEETLKKWQKKVKGKDNLVLSVMFLLPFFPDDVLCFLAGLSSMSLRFFLVLIVCSRVLAIAGTCYSVDFIPFNTWWGILIWSIFAVLLIVLFVVVFKNLDKIQTWLKKRKEKTQKK